MSVLIIATHFLHHSPMQTNIFYHYYLENIKEINENEIELIKLFCNKKYLYSYMVKFYGFHFENFKNKYKRIIDFYKKNTSYIDETIINICLFKTLFITLKSENIGKFYYHPIIDYKNKGIDNKEETIILKEPITIENTRSTKSIFNIHSKHETIKSTIKEFYKVKDIDYFYNVKLFELSYLPDVNSSKLRNNSSKYNEFIKNLPRLYAFISDNYEIINKIEKKIAKKIDNKKPIIKKENNILIVEYSIYLEEFFYAREIHKNYDELQNEIKKNNEIFNKQQEEIKQKKQEYYDTFNSGPLGPVVLGDTDFFGNALRGGKKTKKRSKKKNMRKTRRK